MRDGNLYGEGRIEILDDLDRLVMPVCADDGWNITVADIVCKQIGFEGAFGGQLNLVQNINIKQIVILSSILTDSCASPYVNA